MFHTEKWEETLKKTGNGPGDEARPIILDPLNCDGMISSLGVWFVHIHYRLHGYLCLVAVVAIHA